MAPDEIRALWDAIDRTGSDNVRVIFRTAGADSPLEGGKLASLQEIWRRDEERSEIGYELRVGSLGHLRRLPLLRAALTGCSCRDGFFGIARIMLRCGARRPPGHSILLVSDLARRDKPRPVLLELLS